MNNPVTSRSYSTAESIVKQPYESRRRWVMLALIWLLYFMFGTVSFSMGPLVTPIIEELNISYSQMGIILGSWPFTYVIVSAISGIILDRWGIRRAIFVGAVFISLSAGLRYFAGGFGHLFLFVAMFGIGGPLISIGAPKAIALWFRGKERGTAVGIFLTGIWIGGAVTLSGMNSFLMPLTGYSWRLCYAYLGLVALVGAVLWIILARDVKSTENEEIPRFDKVFRKLFSVRNVQIIIALGFISFAVGHGFTDWLPKIIEAKGFSPSNAGFMASLPILLGIPAVLTLPRIIPPHLRNRFIALSALIVTGAFSIIATGSGASFIAGLVIYGLSFSLALPLTILVLMELPEVGSRHMGAATGMFFCIGELGGVMGPYAVGAITDWTGYFTAGVFLMAGFSIVRLTLALSIKIKTGHDSAPAA